MAEAIVFVVVSAGLVYVSRRSLGAPRSHGLYRLMVWEFIVGLVLVNWRVWFRDPFSWHQWVSWVLLLLALVVSVHGTYWLHRVGRPGERPSDDATLYGFEKTTELVTVGAFRYVRHPIYSSLLYLAWGVFFKNPSPLGGILAAAAMGFLVVTAKVEEAECVRTFGAAYESYMRRTKRFVPFVF